MGLEQLHDAGMALPLHPTIGCNDVMLYGCKETSYKTAQNLILNKMYGALSVYCSLDVVPHCPVIALHRSFGSTSELQEKLKD